MNQAPPSQLANLPPAKLLLRSIDLSRFGLIGEVNPNFISNTCIRLYARNGKCIIAGQSSKFLEPRSPYSCYISGSFGQVMGFAIDWQRKGYAVEVGEPLLLPSCGAVVEYAARLDFVAGQVAALCYPAEREWTKWPTFGIDREDYRLQMLLSGYYHNAENQGGYKSSYSDVSR